MIDRLETRKLLSPADMEPSDPRLRVFSVFNPGVAEVDGQPVLLARVAEAPVDGKSDFFVSPRLDNGELVIDHFSADEAIHHDVRVFGDLKTGHQRLTFLSHLRVVWLDKTGLAVERIGNAIRPEGDLETYGIEDPRITRIDGRWCITYVGVSRHGVSTMLMTTDDFVQFERHGVIFNTMNKDVVLFPEKVGERYAALHRPMGEFNPPEIWVAYSNDLIHWGEHRPLHDVGSATWSTGKTGAGCPPIRVDGGWLEIYHANDTRPGEKQIGQYYGGAMLLDADDPSRVLTQSAHPILQPEADFERTGFVNDVVFPTGLIERDDRYRCYYGAADEHVGVVAWNKHDVLASLE